MTGKLQIKMFKQVPMAISNRFIPLKSTLLHQVLPWILPRKLHEMLILVADSNDTRKIKTLRWLLSAILRHQRIQSVKPDDRTQLSHLQIQNIQILAQVTDLQRSLNILSNQCRLQQEDHFQLERRMIEMKFGQDPMCMSSDSILDECSRSSLFMSGSIEFREIDTNNHAK